MNPKSSLPEDRTAEQKRRDRRSEMLDKFCEEQENLVASSLGMMNDLHKLQDAMDRLTAENNDLKERINTLGVDYDYAKNAAIKSNDELKNVQSQLESKTTALISALSKLDAANASVAKLNSIIQHEEWKQNRSVETAEKEQKRIQDNCNHLNDIVKTQSETIRLAGEKLTEAKRSEDHLARKTIKLYNENQKLSDEITNLKKQIEELKTPVKKSPEDNSNSEKISSEASIRIVNILKRELAKFGNKPFYIRFMEAPGFVENIENLVTNIEQYINKAPQHTPNTSSSSSSK